MSDQPRIERQVDGEVFVDWPLAGVDAAVEFIVEPDGRVLFFGLCTEHDSNIANPGIDGVPVAESLAAILRDAVFRNGRGVA